MLIATWLGKYKTLVGQRGQTILRTGTWSMIAKACAAANLFLAVPFVLNALGALKFGAWATLVSLVAFSGFLDFGLSNGTMNLVAAAHGRGNEGEVKAVIAQGQRTLARIAVCLGVALAAAFPFLPWHVLIGLPASLSGQSRLAAGIVLGAVVLAAPLNLASRVQLGLGRGERAFRWQAFGQILALGLIIVLAKQDASLPVLTAAAISAPLMAAIANTIQLRRDMADIRSVDTTGRRNLGRTIWREGLLFFVLQMAAALAFACDLPLISLLRGADEAGSYAIVQRLFGAISMGLSLVWVPLWPIYRQALAARDTDWVRRTLRRSAYAGTGIAACLGITFAATFHPIISLWIHRPLAISPVMLWGFAVWVTVDALGTAIATLFNAASIMRFQVTLGLAFGMLCIGLKAFTVATRDIALLPWVTVLVYTTVTLVPTFFLFRKLVHTALNKIY